MFQYSGHWARDRGWEWCPSIQSISLSYFFIYFLSNSMALLCDSDPTLWKRVSVLSYFLLWYNTMIKSDVGKREFIWAHSCRGLVLNIKEGMAIGSHPKKPTKSWKLGCGYTFSKPTPSVVPPPSRLHILSFITLLSSAVYWDRVQFMSLWGCFSLKP